MKRLVKDGVIDDQAYGSIPGRDPLEAMKLLQYLYENHRLLKRDLAVIFNDAVGCYDRIRANQAEICSRRVGCSVDIAKTHTTIQTNNVHQAAATPTAAARHQPHAASRTSNSLGMSNATSKAM